MDREEFLSELRKGLSGLAKDEVEERISFYGEMIDDRREEGLSEEEAVAAIGSVDEVIAAILAEIPLSKLVKEKIKPKKGAGAGVLILLLLGAPIWLSLLVAAFAVGFSLYVALWAVIAALWAVCLSLAVGGVGTVIAGAVFAFGGQGIPGLAAVAMGLVGMGLSVFCFYGCKAVSVLACKMTKKMLLGIKKRLIKKEEKA